MTAFLFTLILFLYWAVVGLAVIGLFSPRLRILQGILISPAVGIAMVILPVFLLSRAGLPVRDFTGWLLPALGVLALVVLFIRKPILPWKHLRWFGLILLGALLLASRPMLSYGFDWVSFSNDDMANYCLGAQRFLNHGYFELSNLNLDDFLAGKDYSEAYWFMHAVGGSRSGSELMLAAVWGLTGLNAHQIFMPVIMALHLSLICGGAALAAGPVRSAKAPLIAAGLLAISPMTALGALYQLIAQVGGLTLLCAAVVLFYRKISMRPVTRLLRANVVGAVVFGALFVWYPEVLPFLGLGWFAYLALKLQREGKAAMRTVVPALVIGVLVMSVLGGFILTSLQFMLGQATGGMKSSDIETILFPFLLVPSGIPALLGIIPIASHIPEPRLSVSIAVGLLVLVWIIRKSFNQAKDGTPAAAIASVMLFLGVLLFTRNSDFGLFKLAMFIQPFLIVVVAGALTMRKLPVRWWVAASALVMVTTNLDSQFSYVSRSMGEGYGGLTEIPSASKDGINRQFGNLINEWRKQHSQSALVADTSNVVLAKFQSLYTNGVTINFPSKDFYSNIVAFDGGGREGLEHYKRFKPLFFSGGSGKNEFFVRTDLVLDRPLVSTKKPQSIFNLSQQRHQETGNYFFIDDKPENHLIFIHSNLGNHYYLGSRRKIAFYQLERDPLFPGRLFSGLGRHQLFMVMGATEKPRVVIELTTTVMKQFTSTLPQPTLQGESAISLPTVGRGSARVFSAPVVPQTIDGLPYLGIDMGRDGLQFPNKLTGLNLLYGREIPLDYRRLTTFGRDISLISEAEYRALRAPHALSHFPADLADRGLEYSGIYEDGWISERSFFMLAPQPATRYLVIKGMVPQIDVPDFRNTLVVSIDGKEAVKQSLGLGGFEIKVPVTANDQRHRIDLAFDRYQVLPGEDGRPTGGKIEFIGFTKE